MSFSLSSQICLFRSSLSSLPVSASSVLSVSSSRVNGGENGGKARRALAWITRGINFTFQSLLLSLISWFSGYEIFEKRLLLLWISLSPSLSLCVNTHLTKIKGRLTTSCYCLHYLALRSLPDSTPTSAVTCREGHKPLNKRLSTVKVLYVKVHHNVTCSLYLIIPTMINSNKTRKTTKEIKNRQEIII